jgi:hypothetical protein
VKRLRVLIALLAVCGGANAQVEGPGLTLSIPGAGLTTDLGPSVGLRGWAGGRSGLLASDGLQASSMILADWRPLESGFRVSGGLAYGPLWSSEAGQQYDRSLGDPWSASNGIDPRRWVAQANPYVGLGWGLGTNGRKGPYLSADLGLVYYRNSLATWGCPAGIPSPACTPDLRAGDSAASTDQSRLTPVMSLGVGLRF